MSGAESPEASRPEPYRSLVDRRTTLAWLGAVGIAVPTAAAAQSPDGRPEERPVPPGRPGKGYGTDPALVKPKPAPWPRTLSKAQLQTAALLCDFILPASADAPSANALGVPDFIDEWISAPYPSQAADRPVIVDGLAWVEGESQARFGKTLFDSAPADRVALLTGLTVRPAGSAAQAPHAFFRRFRSLTVGAYYTTQPGFKDIGYIGNVVRLADPGPSTEAKAAVDAALKRMGL